MHMRHAMCGCNVQRGHSDNGISICAFCTPRYHGTAHGALIDIGWALFMQHTGAQPTLKHMHQAGPECCDHAQLAELVGITAPSVQCFHPSASWHAKQALAHLVLACEQLRDACVWWGLHACLPCKAMPISVPTPELIFLAVLLSLHSNHRR